MVIRNQFTIKSLNYFIGMCLRDSCLQIVLDEKRIFSQAMDYCDAQGGHLMEIRNAMANAQAKRIARSKKI